MESQEAAQETQDLPATDNPQAKEEVKQDQPDVQKISTGNNDTDPKTQIKNLDVLLEGYVFLKYGKWGDPAYRTVRISSDLLSLEWVHKGKEKASNSIPVNKLIGIKFGRHTPNFTKHPPKAQRQEELSFTVFGNERNLDLEASTKDQLNLFVDGMISLIQYHKKYNTEAINKLNKGNKK